MLTMCVLMNHLSKKGFNTNFLTWTALRSSIINMKSKSSCSILTAGNLDPMNFDYKSESFNAYTAKCKQFYPTMISNKARIPNGFKKLTADYTFSAGILATHSSLDFLC